MSILADRLKALIRAEGPIPLNVYMQICLHDPEHGYYATRPGLGQDFITAPEISQIFGELIGLWSLHEWSQMGRPSPCLWIEAGPGRGVLAEDALRAMRVAPEFLDALRPVLIEVSPALKAQQEQRLASYQGLWVESLDEVPSGAGLMIANEFLDCLPIRRYVRTADTLWREQRIGIGEDGELQPGLSAPLPAPFQSSPGAEEWTMRPALEALIRQLAERFCSAPGRALFFDYDTGAGQKGELRAFSEGRCVSPLTRPGEVDLTANIDFEEVAHLARAAGLDVAGPVRQGPFLGALGASIRMEALLKKAPDRAEAIAMATARLLDEQDMGGRFGVICLSSSDLPVPAGFDIAQS